MNNPSEEYKDRIRNTLMRMHEKLEQDEILGKSTYDLSWLQEYLRPLAQAFYEGFGRSPIKSERNGWRKAWMDQHQIGLEPQDITDSIREMEIENLTIKGPYSVTAIAEKCRKNRKKLEQANPELDARNKHYEELNKQYEDTGKTTI